MAARRRSGGGRRRAGIAPAPRYQARRWVVLTLLSLAGLAIAAFAAYRQVLERDFLLSEGDRRYLREVAVPVSRGAIFDRNGETLALTTPVESVAVDPRLLDAAAVRPLAKALGLSETRLRARLRRHAHRRFVYLKKRVRPEVSTAVHRLVKSQHIKGVRFERATRRFYLAGEVAAQVLGFTDLRDHGQEGLELAYDEWLAGTPGLKRVLRDGKGRVVQDVESIRPPRPGRPLVTSLDRRLQFLAYRALKAAVKRHRAQAGSAVLLDVRTGEVLAMVNQPSFNPNGVRPRGAAGRNRAVTDMYEPGSTVKPLVMAAALAAGVVTPASRFETAPGFLKVGGHMVRDTHNYGRLDATGVLMKSSNVGISQIALRLDPEAMWRAFDRVGFGRVTASGFPGEVPGRLPFFDKWSTFGRATLAFGYGLAVTPLQLAQAYLVIAADGIRRPVSLRKVEHPPAGVRVMPAAVARQVRGMLEKVVSPEGTAVRARIPGYRVAGKTGTAKKVGPHGYEKDKYLALFAGMAPATRPRLVMVVLVDEPRAGEVYGGQVAAPVFARVMAGALRLLDVPPDGVQGGEVRLASRGERP